MKKLVLVIICILTLSSGPAYAERSTFMLRAQKVDKTPNFPDKGKVPRRMPIIYLEGYTLSLSSFHPEYIINIVQDDEIIYTSIIPEGITEYELPSFLCGECEIQFVSGSFCFTGLIVL